MPLSYAPQVQTTPPTVQLTLTKSNSANITTTATSILSADSSRKSFTIYNNTSSTFFIDSTNTVSATDFMILMPPNSYYEFPNINGGSYTGTLFAICPATFGAGGILLIRELKG